MNCFRFLRPVCSNAVSLSSVLVTPFAEWVARELWSTIRKPDRPLATRLTQRAKREAKGQSPLPRALPAPRPQKVCSQCGKPITRVRTYCAKCEIEAARNRMVDIAKAGRVASQAVGPQARRAETQRRHTLAISAWNPSSLPAWLTDDIYTQKIQPLLAGIANPVIMSALTVSVSYAVAIRAGRSRPHQRHWLALARLTGLSANL